MFTEHTIIASSDDIEVENNDFFDDESFAATQSHKNDPICYIPVIRDLSGIPDDFKLEINSETDSTKKSKVAKYTPGVIRAGMIIGLPYTLIVTIPVTAHYVLGMYEGIAYLKKRFGKQFSPSTINFTLGATAIACYINSASLHGKHNIKGIQGLLAGIQNCFSCNIRRTRFKYSLFNYLVSGSISIPMSLLTALGSMGLSYEGLSLPLSYYYLSGDDSRSSARDLIVLGSLFFAGLDYPQTLLNEGRHTIKEMPAVLSAMVKQLKLAIKNIITYLPQLPHDIKRLFTRFYQGLSHTGAHPDQVINSFFELLKTAITSLITSRKEILAVTLVYILPVMFVFAGAMAYAAQFYYGIDCLKKLIEDLYLIQNELIQNLVRNVFGEQQNVLNLVSKLYYPAAISAFCNSLLFQGKYSIINAIAVEKTLYQTASRAIYEAKYLALRVYKQCIKTDNELDVYEGIFSQIAWPSADGFINFTLKAINYLPLFLFVLIYSISSAGLTFIGMEELTMSIPALLLLDIMVALGDEWQSLTVEGGETKEFIDYIAAQEKKGIAKLAECCSYGDYIKEELTDNEEPDDDEEPTVSQAMADGMRYFLYGRSEGSERNLLFGQRASRNEGSDVELSPAIRYYGGYGTQ